MVLGKRVGGQCEALGEQLTVGEDICEEEQESLRTRSAREEAEHYFFSPWAAYLCCPDALLVARHAVAYC